MVGLIKAGSDVRKNWRTINELAAELGAVRSELQDLARAERGLRRVLGGGVAPHPWEVQQRPADDAAWAEDDWLHVGVEGVHGGRRGKARSRRRDRPR